MKFSLKGFFLSEARAPMPDSGSEVDRINQWKLTFKADPSKYAFVHNEDEAIELMYKGIAKGLGKSELDWTIEEPGEWVDEAIGDEGSKSARSARPDKKPTPPVQEARGYKPCPKCDGVGVPDGVPCVWCGGTGFVDSDVREALGDNGSQSARSARKDKKPESPHERFQKFWKNTEKKGPSRFPVGGATSAEVQNEAGRGRPIHFWGGGPPDPLTDPNYDFGKLDPLTDPNYNHGKLDPLTDPNYNFGNLDPMVDKIPPRPKRKANWRFEATEFQLPLIREYEDPTSAEVKNEADGKKPDPMRQTRVHFYPAATIPGPGWPAEPGETEQVHYFDDEQEAIDWIKQQVAAGNGTDEDWQIEWPGEWSTNESLQLEYEDPTSSKHDDGDSKWSSPLSHKSGMPTEVPQDGAQERSADGWKEMRKSSESGYSSKGDLKKFFGDDPHPKNECGKGCGGDFGETPQDDKEPWEGTKFVVSVGHAGYPVSPDRIVGVFDTHDEALSAGAQVNQQLGHGPDEDAEYGALIDEVTYEEYLKLKREVNREGGFDPRGGNDGDFGETPEKIPAADGDDEEFEKLFASLDQPQQADEPEINWDQLDDESFIDQVSKMAPSKSTPKMKDTIKTSAPADPGDEMTWDELRATSPDEAAEAEQSFGAEALQGATFKKKKSGFLTAKLGDGRRLFYMGDDRGWFDMDDGGSPAGEF